MYQEAILASTYFAERHQNFYAKMKFYSNLLPEESLTKFRNDFGFNFDGALLNPDLKTFRCPRKTIKTVRGEVTFDYDNGNETEKRYFSTSSSDESQLGMYFSIINC